MPRQINNNDLVFHFLNVGFGDNIVIELPVDRSGIRKFGLVDCCNATKTQAYLELLHNDAGQAPSRLAFICATHPHSDHIRGIRHFVNHNIYKPLEFWESGFRHKSNTYARILTDVSKSNIKLLRVSSGMEWYFENVQITALAPSISLRNRYDTYGVDMNNASVVLRFEHMLDNAVLKKSEEYRGTRSVEKERQAGKSVVILAGDAEFDSWAYIVQEYPKLERSSGHKPLVKKMINNLSCSVIKVSHHGSMHSMPLDVYEKMTPSLSIVSTKQKRSSKRFRHARVERDLFPHQVSVLTLEESVGQILTTDGSYESQEQDDGSVKDRANSHPGSIIVAVSPGGKPIAMKLDDGRDDPVLLVRSI